MLLPLIVLPLVAALCGWIADTVLPETWVVGEQFGISPTRAERAYRQAVKLVGFTMAALWWALVASTVAVAILG